MLDLYLRGPRYNARDPEVIALSELLNALGAVNGSRTTETFRNPAGVAMRLRNLAQQDPSFKSTGRRGLRRGGRYDTEVWARFANDPEALALEVARVRLVQWPSPPASTSPRSAEVSRGPVPVFGDFPTIRRDGDTLVYLLKLEGPVSLIFPGRRFAAGEALVKIGRSSDGARRCAEMNDGFPPGSALCWRQIAAVKFSAAAIAHSVEQELLAIARARGWAIGREFAIAPLKALGQELASLRAVDERS